MAFGLKAATGRLPEGATIRSTTRLNSLPAVLLIFEPVSCAPPLSKRAKTLNYFFLIDAHAPTHARAHNS